MGNTVGLPACPRGNDFIAKLKFTMFGGTQPLNLTGTTIAFIANQALDGKTTPQVYVEWDEHTDPINGLSLLQVLGSLTGTLAPGDYFFNITLQDSTGVVRTYAAGTWPITPVPGLISGAP